jgi:arylsulfatase A-like enzyme
MPFFDSNGPLKGKKRDLYEGGIRVPMIARWPGRIQSGTETDLLSGFQDVLPTLAEVAGKSVTLTDGISFLPTLLGGPDRQEKHDFLYWEFYEQGGKRAIRKGLWKGVQRNILRNPDAPVELYDLSLDIGEDADVSAQHPTIVAELKRLMDQSHDERHDSGI